MLTLLSKLFSATVYVAVRRRELLIRDSRTGKAVRLPAAIALDPEGKTIIAVGANATKQSPSQVHWPFDHPRIVIADFQLAEKLLQAALRELFEQSFMRPSPVVVVQSLDDWEAGLSQIERRALLELCYGAGAREVFLWQGQAPSDELLRSGGFRQSLQVLKP
ncbi:MAG: rod shape-determining protein [Pseudomonadota bacterium]